VLDVVVGVFGVGGADVTGEERWQRGGGLRGVDHADHDEEHTGSDDEHRKETRSVHASDDPARVLTGA
jgi:hypothetical protein